MSESAAVARPPMSFEVAEPEGMIQAEMPEVADGRGRRRAAYRMQFSERLARYKGDGRRYVGEDVTLDGRPLSETGIQTRRSAIDILHGAGLRPSLLGEELEIWRTHPKAYDEVFVRGKGALYYPMWIRTGTRLVNPNADGRNDETTVDGARYVLRRVVELGNVAGELWVPPEGIITAVSIHGIPEKTAPRTQSVCSEPKVHFMFDETKPVVDVLVGPRSGPDAKCIVINAMWLPTLARTELGYRSVRGPLPEYQPATAA